MLSCNKLYPDKCMRPGQDEVIKDPRRRGLFRLWLARTAAGKGQERKRTKGNEKDINGKERSGKERAGKRKGTDRKGKGRKGTETTQAAGPGRRETKGKGKGRKGTERKGPERKRQNGKDRKRKERTGKEKGTTGTERMQDLDEEERKERKRERQDASCSKHSDAVQMQ